MVGRTTDRDAELLRQLKVDGRAALDAIIDAHGAAVLRYACRLAASQADAEDLAQETFLTLWSKRRSIVTEQVSLLPWLLTTCRNHGANLYRRNRRNEAEQLDSELPGRSISEEQAIDDLQWVLTELRSLSPLDQEICRLCLVEGLPYRDAAMILGIAPTTLAKRIERTRRRLRTIRSQSEGSL